MSSSIEGKKPSFRLRWMHYGISRNKTNRKKYYGRKCEKSNFSMKGRKVIKFFINPSYIITALNNISWKGKNGKMLELNE